jgi:hypothetical protein
VDGDDGLASGGAAGKRSADDQGQAAPADDVRRFAIGHARYLTLLGRGFNQRTVEHFLSLGDKRG